MADRMSGSSRPPAPSRATSGKTAPAKKPVGASTPTGGKPRPPAGKPRKPGPHKPGRSIVNQKQTPWGLIITTVVVVIFAVGIVGFALTRHKSAVNSADPYRQPELADAKAIAGVTYKVEPNHDHITSGTVNYDSTPPVGGNHSPFWADCTGTVYAKPIANENAVHDLEHGAVWITYREGLNSADVTALAKYVTGVDHMVMTPYPGLKTTISLQAWGYQLALNSSSDPRIKQFIDTFKENPKTTPEQGGSCSQPTFKTNPSRFGHPSFQ
jgi:Protein of unknown function (DUF3105)